MITTFLLSSPLDNPIVTAEKYMEYKQRFGHLNPDFRAPETVLVCYQSSTLKYILTNYPEFAPSKGVTHLYTKASEDPAHPNIGVLADWGVGAPGLAIKMEELIALGTKRFVAIGTAGALMNSHEVGAQVLCTKALAEDGVAHHYLSKNEDVRESIVSGSKSLASEWEEFAKKQNSSLPHIPHVTAWSYSALFRESLSDVIRVQKLGCSVVEMEAATLYAIAQEKGLDALTLFVISDVISDKEWLPRIREPIVNKNLFMLTDLALEFCENINSGVESGMP